MVSRMTGARTKAELLPACRALERIIAHSHYLIPAVDAGTHRIAYNAWRLALAGAEPPYANSEGLGHRHLVGKSNTTMTAYILKRLLLMVPTCWGCCS
jgi:hypothetical protein